MIKNGVTIEKKDNKISFFSHSEKYGRSYLFTKPFTSGEYRYFCKDRSMRELHAFHNWGRNPRLDKTIKRVIMMCKYVEKERAAELACQPILEDTYHEQSRLSYKSLPYETDYDLCG